MTDTIRMRRRGDMRASIRVGDTVTVLGVRYVVVEEHYRPMTEDEATEDWPYSPDAWVTELEVEPQSA